MPAADLGLIVIDAACPLSAADRRATLACGATVTARDDVAVVAVERGPSSQGRILEFVLTAGQSAELPAPAPGMVWTLAWVSHAEADRRLGALLAGAVAVGALAGIGLADVILTVWGWLRCG